MMRKTVRTTSTSWLHTNVRMTSTSEVQRWMISPVEWAVCHAKAQVLDVVSTARRGCA